MRTVRGNKASLGLHKEPENCSNFNRVRRGREARPNPAKDGLCSQVGEAALSKGLFEGSPSARQVSRIVSRKGSASFTFEVEEKRRTHQEPCVNGVGKSTSSWTKLSTQYAYSNLRPRACLPVALCRSLPRGK